ncbi:MAG TPA: hypothetical protein VKB95_14315, partial [Chitinophagaceae bacterium]|nr:hypothetical protein [Chitinophagaceae bacterium]
MVDYILSSLTHGIIDLVPGVPKTFADLLVQNSTVNYAEGNYGKLVLQQVELNGFSIHYNIYYIQTRFLLHANCNVPGLMINIALKNDIQYHLNGIGNVDLKEGQFNVFYLPAVDGTALFEQAGEYRVFKVYLPAAILREYAATFPYVNEFLQQVTGSFPALLLKEHGWINSEISYIVNQLLQCTYDEAVRRLYYDSLVKELLLLLLLQKNRDSI